jgi:hypothetical protein
VNCFADESTGMRKTCSVGLMLSHFDKPGLPTLPEQLIIGMLINSGRRNNPLVANA